MEQRALFQALPDHQARMCLYKVNTGCREQEACQLRRDWEIQVPELNTSVFIIPGKKVKTGGPVGGIEPNCQICGGNAQPCLVVG